MEGMDEIVRESLVECHENLDQLDHDLVAVEQAVVKARMQPDHLWATMPRIVRDLASTCGRTASSRTSLVATSRRCCQSRWGSRCPG